MSATHTTDPQAVRRTFLLDSSASIVLIWANLGLSMVISILIARALGPEGKGVTALVMLLVTQSSGILSLGVEIALIHFVGRQKLALQTISRTAMGLGLALGLAGAAIATLIFWFGFRSLVPAAIHFHFFLLAATIPLVLPAMYLNNLLRVSGRIIEEGFLGTVRNLVLLPAVVIVVAMSLGIAGVLWAFWAAAVGFAAASFVLAARYGILRGLPRFSYSESRPLVVYGLKGHLGSVLQSLNYRFDMYIVGFLLGTGAVGIYSIAVAVAELLWLLPTVLGALLMQRVATRTDEQANALMGPILRLTSLALLVGSLVWALAGGGLIRLLYGQAFASAYLPMLLLLPGIWALGLWKNIMNDLSVRGFPLYKTYTTALAVILTVILDLVLIPLWGIAGAAVASSVAYCAAFVAAMLLYSRVTAFRAAELLLPRRSDFALARGMLQAGVDRFRLARLRRTPAVE
jgi:O-antigen/teichoic acid export membrane protein